MCLVNLESYKDECRTPAGESNVINEGDWRRIEMKRVFSWR